MTTRSIERWDQLHAELSMRLGELVNCTPVADTKLLPRQPGIYLFTEQGKHLYVGRTRKLRGRIRGHSKPTSRTNQAHFAVHLARETYQKEYGEPPQKPFRNHTEFQRHFTAAKQRIAAMDVRYVLTPPSSMDALQAVLEIYVALELQARYNDFATH
jgi:hypothetical protein